MTEITNKDQYKEIKHDIKIHINQILKDCKTSEIPIFITYYVPGEGYIYEGLFPEEIATDNVKSEYWRFVEFLKTVIGFNKEDFQPTIKNNNKENIDTEQDAFI